MNAKNYWYVGDIHGEIRLLDRLLEGVLSHHPSQVVFLGDYIDRGPHARQVTDRLMKFDQSHCCLLGNHELMMLNAIEDPGYGYSPVELWYRNGGEATLYDFGFSSFFNFRSDLDPAYLDFFRKLPLSHVRLLRPGLRILASHAGVSPAIPLEDQLALDNYKAHNRYILRHYLESADSFLWSREDFFNSVPDLWEGHVVVHGHTPVEKMMRFAEGNGMWHFHFVDRDLCFRKERKSDRIVSIDIDSGSAITGRLSALGFFPASDGSIAMHSLTATRFKLISRDLGLLHF